MAMNTDIEPQLRKFVAENLLFTEEASLLSNDESLLAAGVIDSTGIMELVGYVSREFGLDVPMKDINQNNFDSIRRLADYIRRRQGERNSHNLKLNRATEVGLPPA